MAKRNFSPKQKLFLIVKTWDPTHQLTIYLDPFPKNVQRIPKISYFSAKNLKITGFCHFLEIFCSGVPENF